ncbi:MAG: hypothetical protein JWP65_2547 [Ramlibacter sp.]|jgi:hypothetical protein|nr:hypothetical protein [Ramlibacter sp.]
MTGVRVLERVSRHAALGLRFWDVAGAASNVEGLDVTVHPRANPHARALALALPNRSGHLPGPRRAQPARLRVRRPGARSLVVHRVAPVSHHRGDPHGRFLPMAFDADLPARGLLTWLAPWTPPPQPIVLPTEEGSLPPWLLQRVPLFSAPARPLPDGQRTPWWAQQTDAEFCRRHPRRLGPARGARADSRRSAGAAHAAALDAAPGRVRGAGGGPPRRPRLRRLHRLRHAGAAGARPRRCPRRLLLGLER